MQLVVKRTSWWEGLHTKQTAAVWIPVAVAQVGTLAAAGYLYQRLERLEEQSATTYHPPLLGSVLRDVKPPIPVRVSRVPPPPPPPPPAFPAAVPLQVALNNPATLDVMRVGQDFSIAPTPKPVANKPKPAKVTAVTKKVSKQPAVVAAPATQITFVDLEAERTAAANRSELPLVQPEESTAWATLPDEAVTFEPEASVPAAVPAPLPVTLDKKPLPVGIVVWVYLGELRDHGWHGQRLHVAPDSGLPEVGRSYRTQELHGIYDQPHGNRAMAGFQQGDLVTILEVQYETNKGVWAKVRKAEAVGRRDQ